MLKGNPEVLASETARQLGEHVAAAELSVAKLAQGSYFSNFLEPRRTVEKASIAVAPRVSVRSMDDLAWATR